MTRVEALRVDAREAVSSLNGTSGARNYFFVDIRPAADHDGILATGVAASGSAWKTPALVEGVVSCLKELKKNVDGGCGREEQSVIAVVVDGGPERAKEEEEELAECLRALARSGVEHVAVVEGGYYAVHELLYRSGRLDWVVDHEEQQCRVCAHFRLEHVMEKMKASVNSTAQLLATRAKSALQKVQESMQTATAQGDPNDPNSQSVPNSQSDPNQQPASSSAKEQAGLGMKEIQEKAQEGLSALGKKGLSLWSKAVSWTKEKSSSLAEEVSKRVADAVEEKEVPKEDLFIVDEWVMLGGVT